VDGRSGSPADISLWASEDPSQAPDFIQQASKPASGAAWTQVVAAKLFDQFDITEGNAARV
jgi:hypothetical protein